MLRAAEASSSAAPPPVSGRLDPATLRRAVEVVLVCLLAAQCARLIWALLTPVGPLGEPVSAAAAGGVPLPADTSVLERFRPFGQTGTAVVADAAAAAAAGEPPAISLTLHGVRGSMFGDGGAAIIAGPDGKQAPYRVGEAIAPGVVLRAIGRDHAVVSRNGASVRLAFGAPAPVPAATPAPSAPALGGPAPGPPPAAAVAPAAPQGFAVPASGFGAAALGQAGLRPGDVILSVNGQPLNDADAQARLAQALAEGGEAEVRYLRNGITLTTRARLGR